MSRDLARQGDTIFRAALDLPAGERAAYVERACAGDDELRREVESLVAAYERAGSFIERPAIERDAALVADEGSGSLVGQSFGHYRITSLIGSGGMGEVYRAFDAELHRPVAIKFLRPGIAADERRMQRFVQEARAASALNHPNILTVYEIGQTEEGARFFVTEFVDGVTLRETLARRPMKLKEVLDVAVQVASALVAAHAAGIVHRDIKPENIMIRGDGYVKVLDFGLAKLTERRGPQVDTEAATRALVQTDPGAVMGTISYMSPEQASAKEVDARTDIWSLGVVLYETVTGRMPFEGATPSHVVVAILEKEPLPLSAYVEGVPEALEWIVTEALTKDREDRTQTAREMLKKLQRLKQRVDADAQLERSVAPAALRGSNAGAGGTNSDARATDVAAAERATAAGGETTQAAPTVSSAEYVVNQLKRHKWRFVVALSLVALTVVGAGLGLYKFFGRDESVRSGAPFKVTPLTFSPYVERNVAFSPDGKQIAYVWTGESNDNFDIYVKLIGAGEPLRLTNTPAREMSPAWSPDGRYIAFLRGAGENKGFYVVPALGGAERKLADAYGFGGPGVRSNVLDWSPDGKTLAVADKTSDDEPWGIFLLSVDTGERRRLTQPPAGYDGDRALAFSPDGSRLAFVRFRDFAGDIYTVPAGGGEPARITSDEAVISGLAWARDGAEIFFSSDRSGGDPSLWRVPAAGGAPAAVAGVGQNVHEISVARQGDRLAYAQMSLDFNIYRLELTGRPGGQRGAGAPASFLSSTRVEQYPQFSPDGRKVAFMSNRSGGDEIWVCDAEGKNQVQLTDFGSPSQLTGIVSHSAGSGWSPDGRFLAFSSLVNGNADIYVVSADGGSPRRLTTEPSGEITPTWSPDGRWIYFDSNRTGRSEVWKMPAAGGAAVQLTRAGGHNPVASPDGRTVYYLKGRGEPGLWQVSAEGGEETRAFEANIDPANWAVVARGIYFLNLRPSLSQYSLGFFDFATRQTTQVTTLDGPRGTFQIAGITVSPDERWLLYAQRDKLDFDLMLVENFR